MATCLIHEEIYWIECRQPSLEGDPDGLCILHSRREDKDRAEFDKVLEDKLAREDYDFQMVFFPGPVSFAVITFAKKADFVGAKFSEADFRGAEFSEADFRGAEFSEADFGGAEFSEADFGGAEFSEVNFSGAKFSEADFCGTEFSGTALFKNINPPKKGEPRSLLRGDFRFLRLGPEGRLVFRDTDLSRSQFAGTDLQPLEFHNVAWHDLRGRQALYDEVLLRQRVQVPPEKGVTSADYAQVEELYRYLQLNYEKERDYKRMGDFHYGEMEMHRRAGFGRRFFSWHTLYWASSGYGERPLRALICLLGLIAGLAALFHVAELGWSWAGLRDSFLYFLQQSTFQRPDWFEPSSSWGRLLATLGPWFIPGQTALFILALRNRLGRRR